MKIVHTSDWHAGRVWKSISRLDELEACLDHLASYIERELVDLLLVTGDVFDSGAPAARAERIVFRFFKRVGESGTHTVVIAGNHDSSDRFEAWGALTELVNVWALGRPKPAKNGGVLTIPTRSGETAVIAAVPFAAQRRLVSALELADGDDTAMKTYADKMGEIIRVLCRSFRPDTVNLLCLHTHLEGAIKGGSERQVHLGEDWAALPANLPADAHYVALGHIHRPQKVEAPSPAYYAGSPLQLDFGEAGEEKGFRVILAKPGPRPANITTAPYVGAKQLLHVAGTLSDIESRADELKDSGWLRVVVKLEKPDPDVNRRIRNLLPNAVSVDCDVPRETAIEVGASFDSSLPSDVFRQYFRETHGREASDELIETFNGLREEVEES
jgi:exonuclease SbcD